jgi:NADPH:quinone reductase-like Zn-dependent oxidoreductase
VIQIEIPEFGDPEVLTPREVPTPEPGPGEIRIAVEASGVNFADCMARMGLYDKTPELPAVMGWEVAGTVEALGDGVTGFSLGDPVLAVCHFGGYATHVVVDAEQAFLRPPDLDAVTAAAIPVHGLSAYMMLEVMGRVREGDRVLVLSAGGGIGIMCIGFLKWHGAFAVGAASGHKHPLLRDLGYEQLIDYNVTDLEAALADQEGFDLILDPFAGDSWSRSFRLLRGGGRLMVYGYSDVVGQSHRTVRSLLHMVATTPWLDFNPFKLMRENKGVLGMEMEHMWNERDRVRGWMEHVLELWDQGVVAPRIHATVPLTQAHQAHQLLHDRENIGKVILVNQ